MTAHRARIEPLAANSARPLWSVMIPTYHCANYLEQTLRSVLDQDPGPELMHIEVIDDHSTLDNPEGVVSRIGAGRVQFFKQARNVGVVGNFETCLTRSRGRLVHLLHGDDYVLPGFYKTMHYGFEADAGVGAAFCRHFFLEEQTRTLSPLEQPATGVWANALEKLAVEQRIMTPSIVVRRDVYEALGGFDRRLLCSEDWEMWVRIAAQYSFWYETTPLAVYRMHANSNTGRHVLSAEDMRYTFEAIEIFKTYLPAANAETLTHRAKKTYALAAIRMARTLLGRGESQGARAQLREALRMSRSPAVMAALVWSVLRGVMQRTQSQRA